MATKLKTTSNPVSKFDRNARNARRAAKENTPERYDLETDRPYYRKWRTLDCDSRAMFTPYGCYKTKASKLGKRRPSDVYISAEGQLMVIGKAPDERGVWSHFFVPFDGTAYPKHTKWLRDHGLPMLELSVSRGYITSIYMPELDEVCYPGADISWETVSLWLGIIKPNKAAVA